MKILSVKYGDPYSGISEASMCLLSPQQAVIQSRVHQVLYHVYVDFHNDTTSNFLISPALHTSSKLGMPVLLSLVQSRSGLCLFTCM